MKIEWEKIKGVYVDEQLLCMDCMNIDKDIDPKELSPDDFFLSEQLEETDDLFFCDRCGKRIQ